MTHPHEYFISIRHPPYFILDERQKEAAQIKERYPDRIPVIAEPRANSDIAAMDKKKFLVPRDLTVGQFTQVIRKRIQLPPEKALFVYIDKQILYNTAAMTEVNRQYQDRDGFLYVTFSSEKTYGCDDNLIIQLE